MSDRFTHYDYLGIIDWFHGTMTKEELFRSYCKEFGVIEAECDKDPFILAINEKEQFIISTIASEQGEEPFIIRYFGLPDFSALSMSISAVAKISNNGSTYLFSDNKQLIDLCRDDW